jgi:DNA repair exonuclease SbcCD ATPase subunit
LNTKTNQQTKKQKEKTMRTNEMNEMCRKIVENNVIYNQSYLVENALATDFFSYDDIINAYPDHTEEIEELQEKIDELEERQGECQDEIDELEEREADTEEQENLFAALSAEIEKLEDEKQELMDLEQEPQVVLEWWLVSSQFADWLEEKGEVVLKNEYGEYWGRRTSGQAIYCDYIIEERAMENIRFMENLKREQEERKNG